MIENLTSPGQDPVEGDMIKVVSSNGVSYVIRHYHEPVDIIEPTHIEQFSPKELYDSFTTDEALLALMSSNPAVVAQAQLLTVNRGVTISASDAGYQSAIDLLETEGVLTADRAADYRNGIPLGV